MSKIRILNLLRSKCTLTQRALEGGESQAGKDSFKTLPKTGTFLISFGTVAGNLAEDPESTRPVFLWRLPLGPARGRVTSQLLSDAGCQGLGLSCH